MFSYCFYSLVISQFLAEIAGTRLSLLLHSVESLMSPRFTNSISYMQ